MAVNVSANRKYVQGWTNHVHSICLLADFQQQMVEGTWVAPLQPTRLPNGRWEFGVKPVDVLRDT